MVQFSAKRQAGCGKGRVQFSAKKIIAICVHAIDFKNCLKKNYKMQKSILFLILIITLSFNCSTNSTSKEKVVDSEKVENRGTDKENWWDNLPRPAWKKFKQIKN